MTELVVDYVPSVKLVKVRLGFQCKKCNHEWAVFLTPSGRLPYGGDTCSFCAEQERVNRVEDKNGHKN